MNYLGEYMEKNLIDIIKLSRLINCSYNEVIKLVATQHKLSWIEADMLLILSDNKDIINAKDIVNFSKVSKAYVSKSINLLIDKKLISMKVDEKDKRKQTIIINDEAYYIIKELKKYQVIYLSNLIKNINKNDVDKFIELFKLLGNNIIDRKEDKKC